MSRTRTKLLSILLTGLLAAASALAETELAPFELVFELSAFGLSGEGTISLQATETPNTYIYSSSTQATGIARLIRPNAATETSRFSVAGDQLVPDEYRFDSGSGKPTEDSYAKFDWVAGVAHSNHQEELADVALRPGTLDRMSADLQTTLDLQAGKTPVAYTMIHRNAAKTYAFTYQGNEVVETPAGRFETVKYLRQRDGSSRAATIWYAPELDYQPVKVVQTKRGKTTGTLLLKSYRIDALTLSAK